MARSAFTALALALAALPANGATHDSSNISLSGRWASGPCYAIAGAGSIVYAGDGAVVRVLDVSDPAAPAELGNLVVDGYVRGLALSGTLLCVASHTDGLRVLDVSDPANPIEVGAAPTSDTALAVAMSGNTAYVAAASAGVVVFSLANPAAPLQIAQAAVGYTYTVGALGTLAFAGSYPDRLFILDASNPASPSTLSNVGVYGLPTGIAASGAHVFVSASGGSTAQMTALNIGNPALPIESDRWTLSNVSGSGIGLLGTHALFATGSAGLAVLDVADPTNIVRLSQVDTPGFASGAVGLGTVAYVADRNRGVRAIDLSSPTSPVEVGSFETAGKASDVFAAGSLAYVADRDDGLHILDISNPAQPFEIGSLDTPGIPLHVTVDGTIAYLSDDSGGLLLIDVSLPQSPQLAGSYDIGTGAAWECVLDANLAYVAGWNNGLHIVDVSNPAAPVGLSVFKPTTTVLGVDVRYPYAYLACSNPGLFIADISNPAQPVLLGVVDTPRAWDVELDASGNYAIVMDGTSGVTVVDVSDPTQPFIASSAPVGDYAREVDVEGHFAYVASEDSGLRVFDLSNLPAISEVAYYDTADEAWGLYVEGARVCVVDDDDGLWIFENLLAAPSAAAAAPSRPALLQQLWPNPFNPRTSLRFELPEVSQVRLQIFDARGANVRTLLDAARTAGVHELSWDGCDDRGQPVASGGYLVRIEALGRSEAHKVALVR